MRKISSICVALALSAPIARAQNLDRSRRPAVNETTAPFRFPAVIAETLANGLRVKVVEDHSVPVVAVRAVLGVDSTFDPPDKTGLYAVTVGAMREASAKRSADSLAAAAAALGTVVTPTSFTTTTGTFAGALSIMGEMLTTPVFDSTSVERRKAIQVAAARRIAQTPSSVPRHLFYQLLYGADDPYTRSLVPIEAGIQSITTDDVRRFYERFVSPAGTTLVVVGDVSPSAAMTQIRRVFGTWAPSSASDAGADSRSMPAAESTTIHLVDSPGQQAYVYVGAAGPRRSPADAAAAELLGAMATTRMQQELRDKRALMYSGAVGFTWRRPMQPSAFVGSAVVDPRKVDSALTSWLGVLRELRDTRPPSAVEIDAGRRAREGSIPARFDGADSVASRLVELIRDGLSPQYFNDWAARLASMPAAEVLALARRVVDLDHLIIVVSGDRRTIEPALRAANLAPIVAVDAEGRPKP